MRNDLDEIAWDVVLRSTRCETCGALPGQPCVVTAGPNIGAPTVYHKTRNDETRANMHADKRLVRDDDDMQKAQRTMRALRKRLARLRQIKVLQLQLQAMERAMADFDASATLLAADGAPMEPEVIHSRLMALCEHAAELESLGAVVEQVQGIDSRMRAIERRYGHTEQTDTPSTEES